MNEEETKEAWRKAMKTFSPMSDGFWIIGYRNGGNERFAFGIAEDPALKDALMLPQIAAKHWAGIRPNDENDDDE